MMKARLAAVGAAASLALAASGHAAVVPLRPAPAAPAAGFVPGLAAEAQGLPAFSTGYQFLPDPSWARSAGTLPAAPEVQPDPSTIGTETAAMLVQSAPPDAPSLHDVPFHAYLLSAGEYVLAVGTFSAQASVSRKVSAVPLPGAIWLFGSALLAFLGIASRRRF